MSRTRRRAVWTGTLAGPAVGVVASLAGTLGVFLGLLPLLVAGDLLAGPGPSAWPRDVLVHPARTAAYVTAGGAILGRRGARRGHDRRV